MKIIVVILSGFLLLSSVVCGAEIGAWHFEKPGSGITLKRRDDGAREVKFSEQDVDRRLIYSDPIGVEPGTGPRMVRLSGRIEDGDITGDGRFEIKLWTGIRGGARFFDSVCELPRKAGEFTRVWKLSGDEISFRVFLIAGGEISGAIVLKDLKLEILPYQEAEFVETIPENGKVLAANDFSSSAGGVEANTPEVTLRVLPEAGVLRIEWGAPRKLSKGVLLPAVALPRLAAGERGRLRLTLHARGDGFSGRRLEAKPLFTPRQGEVLFVPPYPTVPHGEEMEELRQEWSFDNQLSFCRIYLTVDGDTKGALEVDDFRIEVFPAEEARISTGHPFNVVPAAEGVLTVTPFDPDSLNGGSIVVTDENGARRREFALKAQNRIPLPEPGFYRISVNAEYPERTITTRGAALVTGEPLPADVRARSRYGAVCMSGADPVFEAVNAHWNWNFTGTAGVKLNADRSIIPAPEWQFPTPPGGETIYCFGNIAGFLQPPNREKNGIWMPTDPELYCEVVKRMAASPNFPAYFNVFNEPEGKWRSSRPDFVAWHKMTREAVRAVKPESRVIGPAFCNIDMGLIRKFGELGLYDVLDGVNLHPYVEGTPPEQEFIERIESFEKYWNEAGYGDKPIFYTEFGWTTGKGGWQPPVEENVQKQYVARALTLMGTSQMAGCVYFTLYYRNVNPGEEGFSLVDSSGYPRPGLGALAAVFRHIGATGARGVRLALSPELQFALFRRPEGGMVAAAWNTSGVLKDFPLPFPVTAAYGVTGRPLELRENWELSPDVIFFYSDDDSLASLEELPVRQMLPGDSLEHDFDEFWMLNPVSGADGRLRIAPDAAAGEYRVLGRRDRKWFLQPLKVMAYADELSSEVRWEPDRAPELEVVLHSNFPSVTQEFHFSGGGIENVSAQPDAGTKQVIFRVPLPVLPEGEENVEFSIEAAGKCVWKKTFDLSLFAAREASSFETIDWTRIEGRTVENAVLKCAYTADGVAMEISLEDKVHAPFGEGSGIWRGDSVQFGFDADALKRWEPNAQFGLNGHRVFEYGVADGRAPWRWIAYDPELVDEVAEPRVKSSFERQGNKSVYHVWFPKETLGLKQPLKRGMVLGIAVLVNDWDQNANRHCIRFFGGIDPEKDPRQFGRLYLR